MCMLFAHTSSAKRNGFSPLGERNLFQERAPLSIDSTSAPERSLLFAREARITTPQCQYVSADISSSVRPAAASFAPLSCALHRTSILLRRPPRINSVCRLLSHFLFSSELDFRTFLPLRIEITLEILGRKYIGEFIRSSNKVRVK